MNYYYGISKETQAAQECTFFLFKRQKHLSVCFPSFLTEPPTHCSSECLNVCSFIRCSHNLMQSKINTGSICKYAQNSSRTKANEQQSAYAAEILHSLGHAHATLRPSFKSIACLYPKCLETHWWCRHSRWQTCPGHFPCWPSVIFSHFCILIM